jgi:hypothetical protein
MNIFLKNYCYYLYFRLYYSKYKWSFKKYNKLNNFNYLKLYYKYLSTTFKKKSIVNFYIKTGVVKKLYDFSAFNYSKCYIRLIGWFDKFFMDRDLNFYFIFSNLFDVKKELIKNLSNCFLDNNNLKNNFFFIYKKKININNLNRKSILLTNVFQSFKVDNIKFNKYVNKKSQIIKHISNLKNIIKSKSWVRLCYYPYLYNFKYIVQKDDETHLIYKKLKKNNEIYIKKNIYNQLAKYKMKQYMINNILKVSNNKNFNNNNKHLTRNKYFSKLKKINFENKILNPITINSNLLYEDKFILNNLLSKYFKNLYGNRELKNYNNIFFNFKFKRIFQNKIKLKKIFKKNFKEINKKIIIKNNIDLYKLTLNNFLKFKSIKNIQYNKYNKNIKLINLFIDGDKYNKFKLKNKDYFISLWKIRKQNELFKKNKFRLVEKRRLINRFYFFNSSIYKELFLEYSKKLYSKNKMDEFERSFLRVGPLSFYHIKTQNIGNINNGIYLPSNLLFISNELNNSYSKPFFNLLHWLTKLFIIFFFFSLKEILIDQHNDVLKNKNNKKTLYYFYKHWTIKL